MSHSVADELNMSRTLAEGLGADIGAIEELIHSGGAFARLATDYQDADKMRIEGSPSFVLNEARNYTGMLDSA